MPRTAFERQLSEVQEDMLILATMVESAIDRGIQALRNRDVELARHRQGGAAPEEIRHSKSHPLTTDYGPRTIQILHDAPRRAG